MAITLLDVLPIGSKKNSFASGHSITTSETFISASDVTGNGITGGLTTGVVSDFTLKSSFDSFYDDNGTGHRSNGLNTVFAGHIEARTGLFSGSVFNDQRSIPVQKILPNSGYIFTDGIINCYIDNSIDRKSIDNQISGIACSLSGYGGQPIAKYDVRYRKTPIRF